MVLNVHDEGIVGGGDGGGRKTLQIARVECCLERIVRV